MPRDGSGNFTLPANTQAVSGDPISSTKFNTLVQDLEADANVDRPIAAGGTGASTALAARANLGLVIGTDVQAFDAGLLSIAGLTTTADRGIYTTASDTYAVYTLTAAGRAILDDADASAQRTTLGLGTIATQAANSVSITGGSITGITDLAIADGGTGASDAGAARTNLGLAIGTDVQAYDAGLQSIAGLTTVADRMIYTTASDTYAVTTLTTFGRSLVDDADASAARTTLGLANGATTTISAFALTMLDDVDAAAVRTTIGVGLGTGDLVAANNLSDLANASTARTNLGLAIGTNVQAFDQQLQDIAALAVTDGGFIVGNGSTFVLETDATARTSLGLGTSATVNTGTSGATIPLLNAANTFSAGQTFSSGINTANAELSHPTATFIDFKNDAAADFHARFLLTGGTGTSGVSGTLQIFTADLGISATNFTCNGNTVWHAGNDAAGSGLDADTLDGVQGSAFALLATDNTFARNLTFSGYRNIRMPTGNASGQIQGRYDTTGGTHDHFIMGVNWLRDASGSSGTINSASLGTSEIELVATNAGHGVIRLKTGAVNTAPTDRVVIDNNGLQARTAASTETTGTLTVASANKTIQATGDITIPNAVFAAGDIILIYAGASARTITEGASVTMRLGGTATTGSRTLAARGVALLFFVSSSEVVVSGGAVT